MIAFKNFLTGCSYIFGVFLIFYILAAVQCIFHKREYGWDSLSKVLHGVSPLRIFVKFFRDAETSIGKMVAVIIPVFLIAGAANIVLFKSCATNQIGAFYEKPEYIQDYDATLDMNGHSIFCIATIEHMSGNYWITKIELPYNHVAYTGEEYYPWDDTPSICIGEEGWYCDITLGNPSNGDSYEKLLVEDLPDSGEFCASKKSGIFHYPQCECASNIENFNLIYFQNECEADVFGYTMCPICRDLYY